MHLDLRIGMGIKMDTDLRGKLLTMFLPIGHFPGIPPGSLSRGEIEFFLSLHSQ